jgi:glycosyltransferase involved in cell wall biosynthesis
MMEKNNSISLEHVFVVIPAFNEEKHLGRVIRGLFEQGFKNVVVVDDGSKDATHSVAEETGAIVLTHVLNLGQGAALQTGNEYAVRRGAEWVVHFDGDDQFNPHDILPALEAMNECGADVLLGSRFLGAHSQIPFTKKYLILPVSRVVNLLITGVVLTDAHNGFRILSRRALEEIQITQNGMAHNSEIISQLKKKKLPFKEYPVQVVYHEYGQRLSGGLKILKDIIVSQFLSR